MVSATIDHMTSMLIFIAATMLFIGLFNQTIQTAIVYQNHRALATKASDMLDAMLLTPGNPAYWGRNDVAPMGFGLQDPEFTQYQLDAFSLMRLDSTDGTTVYYQKANGGAGAYFGTIMACEGTYLLLPKSTLINYATAQRLLGVNGTYGFQLTLTPLISVAITEVQSQNPLNLSIQVEGTGFPLANAQISYKLFRVELKSSSQYPVFSIVNGTTLADAKGSASVAFAGVSQSDSYAFIASVHLAGLSGVGYHVRTTVLEPDIDPMIGNLTNNQVILAHSGDLGGSSTADLTYNTTMVNFNHDSFALQSVMVNETGVLSYGAGYPYGQVILSDEPGILIVAYNSTANQGGLSLMSWGLASLSCQTTFGGNPTGMEWVATDMRQTTINGVSYQAKIAIWSYQSFQVRN
jgi:hypothetical protein